MSSALTAYSIVGGTGRPNLDLHPGILNPPVNSGPALREELDVPVPADRRPGRTWHQGPSLAVVSVRWTERAIRIGYARTSTARQELASQLEAPRRMPPS
jgi:hypothetical protein